MTTSKGQRAAKKVLVVEDQGVIAMDLKRRLENCGYSVAGIAGSANDAVRFASSQRPDVILMDIRLKGTKDGIDAAAEVRASLDIPVIFVTAHADSLTLERALQTGPFGYIVKPFSAADLRAQIEMACSKHQTERELRTSRALLATTLRSIGEAVITTDAQGRIEFMNSTGEAITGLDLSGIKGKNVVDVFPLFDPESGESIPHPVLTVLNPKGETAVSGEYRLRSPSDSSPLVHAVVSENRNEDGLLGSVIALRDVTAQRQMEKQVRLKHNMETVSVMAGSLAHDFNNLLTVILGYVDFAKGDPFRSDEALEEIRKAAESAASVCRQLLTVSKNEVVKAEVIDLNTVVANNSKAIQQILGHDRSLVTKTFRAPLPVRSERTQLQRVLVNLAIYARESMEHGGTLTIATRRDESGWAEISFSDTGTEMTAAARERIFEPFFSPKGGPGAGLGMTIVHSIVSRWSGKIKVESEPGRGSVFLISFPLEAEMDIAMEKAPAGPTRVNEASSEGSILLVEDEPAILELFLSTFKLAGFRMLAAGSGEEALTKLSANREAVDLLITDVVLPKMTGLELAKRCKEQWPQIHVLFISGYSMDEFADDELLASGQAEFIPKPVSPSFLVSRARDIIANSRHPQRTR